jgi:hypothetical protein
MAKRKAKKRAVKKVQVIDLKRKSAATIKKALQSASKRKVAIIVLNAPFKLAAAA